MGGKNLSIDHLYGSPPFPVANPGYGRPPQRHKAHGGLTEVSIILYIHLIQRGTIYICCDSSNFRLVQVPFPINFHCQDLSTVSDADTPGFAVPLHNTAFRCIHYSDPAPRYSLLFSHIFQRVEISRVINRGRIGIVGCSLLFSYIFQGVKISRVIIVLREN